ncbi:SagB family peptide dehydrogenase [Streptomyces xanthophaeus]
MTTPAPPVGEAALGFLGSGHQPPDALPAADPARLPPVHKRYPSATRLALPPDDGATPYGSGLPRLSRLLRQTNGLTRMRWMSGLMPLGLSAPGTPGERRVLLSPGRTAAASGSRYPVEVYVAHGPVDGLTAGLSHYDPVHHALERLRDGDGRARLLGLLSDPPAREAEFVLLLSSVLWRNAAKYGAFGYRLQSLDVGVVAAQAVAAAGVAGLTATVHLHYDDPGLDEVLGLSPAAESVFAVVTLHRADGTPGPPEGSAPWDGHVPAAVPGPRSLSEVPHLAEAALLHAAIRTAAPGRAGRLPAWSPPPGSPRHALPTAALDLAEGFPGRRTVYGYRPGPVPERTLAALLSAAAGPLPAGSPPDAGSPDVQLAAVVQRVPGVETGAHLYDATGHALVRTRSADAVREVMHAAKSPMLADECRTATATLVPCADLRTGIERFGDRWYRTRNIAAGALAQRLALAAAAMGLESHVHCDFGLDAMTRALGLGAGPLQPLVAVTVGPRCAERADPQLPLRA